MVLVYNNFIGGLSPGFNFSCCDKAVHWAVELPTAI